MSRSHSLRINLKIFPFLQVGADELDVGAVDDDALRADEQNAVEGGMPGGAVLQKRHGPLNCPVVCIALRQGLAELLRLGKGDDLVLRPLHPEFDSGKQ